MDLPRPSLGDPRLEIDEELLRKSFEEPLAPPGAVVCRFCRGALDPQGDFCEHCGAPVAEAAPPGALVSKPSRVPLPGSSLRAVEPPLDPPAPDGPTPPELPAAEAHRAYSLPDDTPGPGALYPTPLAADFAAATSTDSDLSPAPIAATSPSTPPAGQHRAGFMGRLKGLFKKG